MGTYGGRQLLRRAILCTRWHFFLTVREFFNVVNGIVGKIPFTYSIEDIANLTNDVTAAFEGGVPSLFAQQHLVNGVCP